MTFALALFLLGVSASAERRLDVQGESIAAIIVQVAWGTVKDVAGKSRAGGAGRVFGGLVRQEVLQTARLWIDGQPRTGIFAWLAAVNRVAGYALDRQHVGSVEYGYQLRVRGYMVRRSTSISDGAMRLTTSTGWTETVHVLGKTRRMPINVVFTIRARERADRTELAGEASGVADVRDFRCSVIRSAADRRATAALDDGLRRGLLAVENRGTAWYRSGEFSPEIDRLRREVQAVLQGIGRLRR